MYDSCSLMTHQWTLVYNVVFKCFSKRSTHCSSSHLLLPIRGWKWIWKEYSKRIRIYSNPNVLKRKSFGCILITGYSTVQLKLQKNVFCPRWGLNPRPQEFATSVLNHSTTLWKTNTFNQYSTIYTRIIM